MLRKCALEKYFIQNVADLNQILGCEHLSGEVVITGYHDAILKLNDLIHLDGLFEVRDSPDLVRIELPNLELISGEFKLHELTSLGFLQAPNLSLVSKIHWSVLPILSAIDISFEKISSLTSIVVSDTSLSYIMGITSPTMSQFNINNNRFLESVSADVESVTEMLHIAANGDRINVDLPRLHTTRNLSIHNVEQLNLRELKECKGSMSLSSNELNAVELPQLTKVGGTLSLNNNLRLTNVLFVKLEEVDGGLVLANNTYLSHINFFPELNVVGGALELVGPIKEVKMPNLRLVRGSARIKSTDASFNCLAWSKSEISAVVRGGKNECTNSQNQNYIATSPSDGYDGLLASTVEESGALSTLNYYGLMLLMSMGLMLAM